MGCKPAFMGLLLASLLILSLNGRPVTAKPRVLLTGNKPCQQNPQEFAAQRAWNEKLRKARNHTRNLERQADQTELEINRLRNFLFSAERRSAKAHNQTANQLADLDKQLRRLRDEARRAQAEVGALLEEGAAQRFKLEGPSLTTPSGTPNPAYYRSRFNELQTDRRDAERHVEVVQLRINDLNRRITLNSGTGDNFFIGRLRDELQQAQQELELTRGRLTRVSKLLDELFEQARVAGISTETWKVINKP